MTSGILQAAKIADLEYTIAVLTTCCDVRGRQLERKDTVIHELQTELFDYQGHCRLLFDALMLQPQHWKPWIVALLWFACGINITIMAYEFLARI